MKISNSVCKSRIHLFEFFCLAGMTCYLNAVLQTLLGSKFFSSALLKCKNLVESSSNVHGELFNVFINVAKNKENGHQELVRQSLFQLRRSLRQILPQFADASMQDAHEFLVKFFEVFGDTLKENGMTNKCPFSQTFEYQMSERKQCLKCNHSTTKFKTEWVLRLDMPPDTNSSSEEFVKRSIQNLMERTLLGTMDMRCVNCNNLCTLHQSTEKFSKLPPILIVYLPRSFFINERNSRKNRTLILTNVVLKLPDQVTPDVDCSKLSKETLVITTPKSKKKRSQIELLFDSSPETPEKKSKLSFSSLDKDINNLSEEEQVKLALQKSLCESTQIDEEDNRLLAKVIEESLKGVEHEEQEESVLLDEDIRGDIIDIKGEKTVASGEYDYQLTATICHINRSSTSVDMGHYIADVFNGELKQWFRCNDMRVFPTLLQSVVQQSTYDGTILFYTHRNFLEM